MLAGRGPISGSSDMGGLSEASGLAAGTADATRDRRLRLRVREFVGGRISQPMTYAAVHKLVARLQAQGSRKPRRSTSYRA